MGWGLAKIDPMTLEPIDGEDTDFDPEPMEWQELDLLLVGSERPVPFSC